jgi:hypothetical protein
MMPRYSHIFVSILIFWTFILAGCSGTESLPPATATAQIERIQKMATQMAGSVQGSTAVQSTAVVPPQQATETASAGLTMLNEASGWRVVISDTFDSNKNQWITGTKDGDLSTENLSIDGGKYKWTATAKESFVYWTTPTTDTIKDFYLAVDAQQIDGPDDGDMSLVFHEADTSNFFLFEVSSVKQFSVSQLVQYEWQTRIDWTDSDLIQPFQTNHLVVIGKGATFYFFINKGLVGSYTEPTPSEGSPGVAVALYHKDDTGNFTFDNFELREP